MPPRFAKLQDTLGSAMRHAALFSGEQADTFLRVLVFFEKIDVLSSIDDWQAMRALAHEYETDYGDIADHFNSLKELVPQLYYIASSFSSYCQNESFPLPKSLALIFLKSLAVEAMGEV